MDVLATSTFSMPSMAGQLVKELKRQQASLLPHRSSMSPPAGAAIGLPMSETLKKIYFVDDIKEPLTPIATAYARTWWCRPHVVIRRFHCAFRHICRQERAQPPAHQTRGRVMASCPWIHRRGARNREKEKRKRTCNVIKTQIIPPAPMEHKRSLVLPRTGAVTRK